MADTDKEQIKKISSELNSLKSQISESAKQKEFWFRKKEDLKKEINDMIKKIKEIKSENDESNIQVQDLKKNRDKYNSEVHTLIEKIKKINEEKAKELKKYNVALDPSKIQSKINALEKQVETETNFNKEKKLMGEINRLKKSYAEFSSVMKIEDEAKKISDSIKASRKKANEFHKQIQDLTKDATYGAFMDLSKKITELKKVQEDAFNKFIEFKNKYLQLNQDYKKKQEEAKPFQAELEKEHDNHKVQQQEKQTKILKQKTEQVEEKIKKKKKLTTEDILAFQGTG